MRAMQAASAAADAEKKETHTQLLDMSQKLLVDAAAPQEYTLVAQSNCVVLCVGMHEFVKLLGVLPFNLFKLSMPPPAPDNRVAVGAVTNGGAAKAGDLDLKTLRLALGQARFAFARTPAASLWRCLGAPFSSAARLLEAGALALERHQRRDGYAPHKVHPGKVLARRVRIPPGEFCRTAPRRILLHQRCPA